MQRRRRLGEIQLQGGRKLLRELLFWGLAALAALGALGYVLPAHRVGSDPAFHANYADGGPTSLVVFGVVLATALALRGRRFGSGLVTGAAATGGAIGAIAPVVLAHFLSTVEYGPGESMFAVAVLGLFFGGIVLGIAEPILFFTQRRALERADRDALPKLPLARVVS